MSWPDLWFLPRALLYARGPRVSADARSSLHPRFGEGLDVDDQPGRVRAAGMMRCVLMRTICRDLIKSEAGARCVDHRRHCERSEAIQGYACRPGLLRCTRNDAE